VSDAAAVSIVEVGPRDGLQSLDAHIDTDRKLAIIERLLDAGLTQIEVTSFAHPKVVPRLADAEELMGRLPRPDGVSYRALVPNVKGAQRAIAAGAAAVSMAFGSPYEDEIPTEDVLGLVERCAELDPAWAVQVESSICGLGGPIVRSPGTEIVGNLATESLVANFAERAIETGLDPAAMRRAAGEIATLLDLSVPI
jgi:isopropylmalate/homocitrate/citramalate synthase